MALRVLSLVLPLLLVLTVAVNTATREYSQQREATRAKVAPRGRSGAMPATTPRRTEYSQQREAARAKVTPRGRSGALPPTTPRRTEYSQQREAARAKVAPRGPSGALPPTTPPLTEYSHQREAARAKVAPRGRSGALPPTTPPRTEYSQQREAARAKVTPRGPFGALPPTTPQCTGTWAARNNETARIIDGKPAYVSQFPHQAFVSAERGNYTYGMPCGGSLISKSAVLTGAQCVDGFVQWTIRLGGIHRTEDEETAWTTVSSWALMHPDFNKDTFYANLAIIFLVRDAPLSDFIKPVALPSSLEASTNYNSKTGVISGWGYNSLDNGGSQEVLHWTEVKVIPTEICEEFWTSIDMTDKLCAANENSGGYWGDYNTGLTLRTSCGFTQIGILSLTSIKKPANKTWPAPYTRVASYIDWINIKAPISNWSVAN